MSLKIIEKFKNKDKGDKTMMIVVILLGLMFINAAVSLVTSICNL